MTHTVFGESVEELLDLMTNHRTLDTHQPDPGMVNFTVSMPPGRRALVRAMMRAEAALLILDADLPDAQLFSRNAHQRAFDAWVLVMRDCMRARGGDLPGLEKYRLP